VLPGFVAGPELTVEIARLSHECGCQIGVLIDRSGSVKEVVAGTAGAISVPELPRPAKLQGLRFVHTHFKNEPLNQDDLTALSRYKLDLCAVIGVDAHGQPTSLQIAHLKPASEGRLECVTDEALRWPNLGPDFSYFIEELESAFSRRQRQRKVEQGADRAILAAIETPADLSSEIDLAEFTELAHAAGVEVIETIVQRRPKPDPKYVVGKGKLEEICNRAHLSDANLLIIDAELSPSQAKSISLVCDLRVLDRTQLILDIFAQRARTREGKIQVELAQLKYNMPRLVGGNPSLSRLAGGIGTRGPGESKLEIDRRRAQERVKRLENEIREIRRKRGLTRAKRNRGGVPVISIIGYTNTGKSTLLNTLTRSEVLAADMPFATLDPSSKRLRFPEDREVIITDTVGFIRDLPPDLKDAFMATLEELSEAQLLLEVIDLSDPHLDYRMQAVEEILTQLELNTKPRLRVFNKADKVDTELAEDLARRFDGVVISALNRRSLNALIERLQRFFRA